MDISAVVQYYQKWGIELSKAAISFFEEYLGIARWWYIGNTKFEGDSDFEFELFPYPQSYQTDIVDYMYDDAKYTVESEEYQAAKACAKEPIILVGEIGHHYPARVWIGNSGILYGTHKYEGDVRKLDSLISLIHCELLNSDLESVVMKP